MSTIRLVPDVNYSELARATGWSTQTIRKVFNPDDPYYPSVKLRKPLADALGLTVDEFEQFLLDALGKTAPKSD